MLDNDGLLYYIMYIGQDFKNEIKKDIIDLIDGINKAKDGEE